MLKLKFNKFKVLSHAIYWIYKLIAFLWNFFLVFFENLLTRRLHANSAKTSKIHQLIEWFQKPYNSAKVSNIL